MRSRMLAVLCVLALALALARPTVNVFVNGAQIHSSSNDGSVAAASAEAPVTVKCTGTDSQENHIDMYIDDYSSGQFIWGDAWNSVVDVTYDVEGTYSLRCQGRVDCGAYDMGPGCRT